MTILTCYHKSRTHQLLYGVVSYQIISSILCRYMLKIIHLLMITVVNNCSMIQEHPASVSMAIETCIQQSSPSILSKVRR